MWQVWISILCVIHCVNASCFSTNRSIAIFVFFILCILTSLLKTVFGLFRCSQFLLVGKVGVPRKNTDFRSENWQSTMNGVEFTAGTGFQLTTSVLTNYSDYSSYYIDHLATEAPKSIIIRKCLPCFIVFNLLTALFK